MERKHRTADFKILKESQIGQAREEDFRPAEMGVVVVQAEQDVAWRRGWHCKRQKGLKGRKRRKQPFAKEALSLEP